MRTRPDDEHGFAYYWKEKLLESLSFPRGHWRRKQRNRMQMAYRSPYIDLLCRKVSPGDFNFGDDDKDEPRVYQELLDRDVDPNYLLYLRLDSRDKEAPKQIARTTEDQLSSEALVFQDRLRAALRGVTTSSGETVRAIFMALAEQGEIPVVFNSGRNDPVIVLKVPLQNGCALYLDWQDEFVLHKWGRLQIGFTVDRDGLAAHPKRGFASDAPRFGLASFIPGGEWYTRTGGNLLRMALGVYAHTEFMRLQTLQCRIDNSNELLPPHDISGIADPV